MPAFHFFKTICGTLSTRETLLTGQRSKTSLSKIRNANTLFYSVLSDRERWFLPFCRLPKSAKQFCANYNYVLTFSKR